MLIIFTYQRLLVGLHIKIFLMVVISMLVIIYPVLLGLKSLGFKVYYDAEGV